MEFLVRTLFDWHAAVEPLTWAQFANGVQILCLLAIILLTVPRRRRL